MVASELPSRANRPSVNGGQYQNFRKVPVSGSADIYVQAGAFQTRDNAIRLKGSLERSGFRAPGVEIRTAKVDGLQYYRVQIGPIAMVDLADQTLAKILESGYAGARIVIN